MENVTNNEEVSVPRSLLEEMMKEIKDLKEANKKTNDKISGATEEEEVSGRNVRMRLFEGKVVVGFDKVRGTWKKYDGERREDRLMMDIIVFNQEKDKDDKYTVDYIRFMEESPTIELPLIKVSEKKVTKDIGFISVKQVIDYNTVNTPNKVMQKVISTANTATVKMPDGKEREIDIDFVNI